MSEGQVVESNPAETAPAVPNTDQAAPVSSGTPESQNGQAATQAQSAPAEESFSNLDPKSLPPEMQAFYKSLQADYTRKMQTIAETRKKAEAYDQISSDQRFREYWSGLSRQEKADFREKKAEVEKAIGQKISDDEFSKSFESKDQFLGLLERVVEDKMSKSQARIQELEQKLTVSEASDVVESFATELGPDGKAIRPDFYELDDPKFQLITGFLQVNPPAGQSPEAYRERLSQAYSWAQSLKQEFYNRGRNEALAIIQKKSAASSEMPTQAAKGVYQGPDPKKLSTREAMDLAKKGIKIPQVYD